MKAKFRTANGLVSAAHRAVTVAVKNGSLIRPSGCQRCGLEPRRAVHAHHNDYSKPLDVQWLCVVCHAHVHNDIPPLAMPSSIELDAVTFEALRHAEVEGRDASYLIKELVVRFLDRIKREPAVFKETCMACRYQWYPKAAGRPNMCPTCKSPRWDGRTVGRPKKRRAA